MKTINICLNSIKESSGKNSNAWLEYKILGRQPLVKVVEIETHISVYCVTQ